MSAAVAELVNALTLGMACRSIYFAGHPKVLQAAATFKSHLDVLLEQTGTTNWCLGIVNGRLIHDGRAQLGLSLIARRLIEWAERQKCAGFVFHSDLTEDELKRWWECYVETRDPVENIERSRSLLQEHGIRRIELLSIPAAAKTWDAQELVPAERLQVRVRTYQGLLATVEEAHRDATRGNAVDANIARTQAEGLVKVSRDHLRTLMELSHYPDYDGYTIGHSVRVALLAVLVGSQLELRSETLIELGTAGLLHDVGKSRIPPEILYKNGPLDRDERRVMTQHPRIGGELMIESPDAGPMCVGAAYGHHVRFDRLGYPTLRAWGKVGMSTAIIQVCDVFEALTAVRPYKAALAPRQAYEILLRDKDSFHPSALRAFCRAIGLYPPGTRVLLSDGTEAVVVRAGTDMTRPIVQRFGPDTTGAGTESEGTLLDLGDPQHTHTRIRRILPPAGQEAKEFLGTKSVLVPASG